MPERVTCITAGVSNRLLLRAVIRLDGRKHPQKLTAIQQEMDRRRVLGMERKAA